MELSVGNARQGGRFIVWAAGKLVAKDERAQPYIFTVHPLAEADIRADVVFLHGIGGDGEETWTSDEGLFFPLELSKVAALQGIRFLSVDYPTSLHRLDSVSEMLLPERAMPVRDALIEAGVGKRPYVLVCHSMGGLIAKTILNDDWTHAKPRRFWPALRGVAFLATPHDGSGVANVVTYLARLVGNIGSLEVSQLRQQGWGDLERLHADFLAHVEEQRTPPSKFPRLTAFWESAENVVDRKSATRGIDNAARDMLTGEHGAIARPHRSDAQSFTRVRALLVELLADVAATERVLPPLPDRVLPRSAPLRNGEIVRDVSKDERAPRERRWGLVGTIVATVIVLVLVAAGLGAWRYFHPASPTEHTPAVPPTEHTPTATSYVCVANIMVADNPEADRGLCEQSVAAPGSLPASFGDYVVIVYTDVSPLTDRLYWRIEHDGSDPVECVCRRQPR